MSVFFKFSSKFRALSWSILSFMVVTFSSIPVTWANTLDTTQDNLPLADVELSVGVSLQPPFAFVTEGVADLQGIDIEIIKELQRRTGFKIKDGSIKVMHFSSMMEDGQNGSLDIIAGGITQSENRKELFDFSETVYSAPLVLVARKDSGIRTISDLKNRTLATEKGTVSAEYIPNVEQLNIQIQENLSVFMSMYAVHAKLADAVIMDAPMAYFYINNWHGSNLQIVSHVSPAHPMGIFFRKNSKFTPYLQEAMHDMIEDFTVETILSNFLYLKLK